MGRGGGSGALLGCAAWRWGLGLRVGCGGGGGGGGGGVVGEGGGYIGRTVRGWRGARWGCGISVRSGVVVVLRSRMFRRLEEVLWTD